MRTQILRGPDRWRLETRHLTGIRGALEIKWKEGSELNHKSNVADTASDDP